MRPIEGQPRPKFIQRFKRLVDRVGTSALQPPSPLRRGREHNNKSAENILNHPAVKAYFEMRDREPKPYLTYEMWLDAYAKVERCKQEAIGRRELPDASRPEPLIAERFSYDQSGLHTPDEQMVLKKRRTPTQIISRLVSRVWRKG